MNKDKNHNLAYKIVLKKMKEITGVKSDDPEVIKKAYYDKYDLVNIAGLGLVKRSRLAEARKRKLVFYDKKMNRYGIYFLPEYDSWEVWRWLMGDIDTMRPKQKINESKEKSEIDRIFDGL